MTSADEEIQKARIEEERRSKRPIDFEAKKRLNTLLRKFREALEANDVEAFKEAIIHDLGLLPGTPEYRKSLKAWYDHHGRS
jgi:hypothetical protein